MQLYGTDRKEKTAESDIRLMNVNMKPYVQDRSRDDDFAVCGSTDFLLASALFCLSGRPQAIIRETLNSKTASYITPKSI